MVKQNIIFVANKAGSLQKVTGLLAEHGINIYGFACFDAPEFALFRMVSDNAEKAAEALTKAGYMNRVTDVIAVDLKDEVGGLNAVLQVVGECNVNLVLYLHLLSQRKQPAYYDPSGRRAFCYRECASKQRLPRIGQSGGLKRNGYCRIQTGAPGRSPYCAGILRRILYLRHDGRVGRAFPLAGDADLSDQSHFRGTVRGTGHHSGDRILLGNGADPACHQPEILSDVFLPVSEAEKKYPVGASSGGGLRRN